MRVDTAHFLLALQSLDLINHGRTGHPGPLAAMPCDGESLWLVSLDPKCELWWRLPAKYATSCFPAVYIDVRAAHAQLDGLRHHLGPEIKIEWDRQRIEYGPGVQAATPRRQRFQPPTWFYEPAHGDRFNPAALRRVWLPMLPALRYFMQDGAHASYFYGDGMWNALSCGDHTFSVRHAWGRPVTACTVRPYFIWTRAFPALDIAMQQDTPVYCAASRSGHEVHLGQPYVGWLLRSIVPAKDRCAPPLAAAYRLLAETKTAPLQDMAETLTQMDAHT